MLKNSKAAVHVVSVIAGVVASGATQADDYHYVNLLVGDRAGGMGGAYTAVSDDPTGLFYNPAGIVYAPGSSLTGSMNTYQESRISYKNVLGGRYDWTRNSNSLLPNFFGIVQPLGKGMLGFSYAVPNSIEEDQDQVFDSISTTLGTAKFIINFNNSDNTYQFGPSYAYKINDDLSIGVTGYFHYRHQQRISNTILLYNGDRVWSNDYFELEEFGFKPLLGLMWSPMDRLALGLTYSKVSIMDSTVKTYQTCLGANSGTYAAGDLCQTGDVVNHLVVESNEKADYPNNVRMGAAWFVDDALLLSGDLSYFDSVGKGINARESVVNFAFGAEYYLNTRWALRGGLYSDYANTPSLKQNFTSYNQPENVDLYGLSASISHFTRNSSLTLSMNYATGSGKAQIVSGSTALQDVDVESFGISVAAAYSY